MNYVLEQKHYQLFLLLVKASILFLKIDASINKGSIKPDVGKRFNVNEKNKINIKPNQNEGIDKPKKLKTVTKSSKKLFKYLNNNIIFLIFLGKHVYLVDG